MTFDEFLREIGPDLDLDWRKYRKRAARHRVDQRLHMLGFADYASFLARLRADPEEAEGLPDRMRVTVSRFFRERGRWDRLAEIVLPALLSSAPCGTLRAWSAGCCGGEEPYTASVLWQEHIQGFGLHVLATDIDEASLARAREALYEAGSLREVSPEVRARWFNPEGAGWRLRTAARRPVRLLRHNLMGEPPPEEGMDLVLCRYLVFTYYRGERRFQAARRLWSALRPEGALMIGRKEGLGPRELELFEPWPEAAGVFRKRATEVDSRRQR